MTKEALKRKVWTKPELKRLGTINDVRAGTNISTANGSMS